MLRCAVLCCVLLCSLEDVILVKLALEQLHIPHHTRLQRSDVIVTRKPVRPATKQFRT
jgi:hypothetical protein